MKALIVGVGKLGFKLAGALLDEGYEICVIDNNEDVIENVSNVLDVFSVCANALDFGVLMKLDISTFDIVISTTTNDEANVILCSISKKLGAKYSIARVRDPEYRKYLKFMSDELDIDYIINPEYATAKVIDKYLLKKYQLYANEVAGGKIRLVEFNIGQDPEFIGKKLIELDTFDKLIVAAISRDGKAIVPNGMTELKADDVILLSGITEDIEAFDKKYSGISKEKTVRKVMILGGGKVGFYLASLLVNEKIDVTVIELNRDTCVNIKEKLPGVEVINGDGTDINLLEEEMFHTFDAYVAATGIDEANLLMSLVVKRAGIYKSVAKISRTNYDGIIDKLNIDAVFNKSYITASEILKIIRGNDSQAVSLLLNAQVECNEFILKKKLAICGKSLKDLALPKGILFIALIRGEETIVPNGDTVLENGDKAVVFATKNEIRNMKNLFKRTKIIDGIHNKLTKN